MCSRCETLLTRDFNGTLIAAKFVNTPPPGKRACSRCGTLMDLTAQRCPQCRRSLHNAHRVGGMAIVLALLLIAGLVAINIWFKFLGRVETQTSVNAGANKKPERVVVSPTPVTEPLDTQAARENFVARLKNEHRNSHVKVKLSGDDLTVITFTGGGFTGGKVKEFTANEDMMGTLRTLGFRRIVFSNGVGSTWSHSLDTQQKVDQ